MMLKRQASCICVVLLVALGLSGMSWADDAAGVKVRMATSQGDIVLTLDRSKAPVTVDSFVRYANEGFFDGTVFHRVIKGFMIQGGGLTEDMQKKVTHPPIINEADNGLKNVRGAIAMARTQDPNSATAQFFINTMDNAFLDHKARNTQGWGYCVFGKVTEGMDVVDAIEKTPTKTLSGRKDVPATPVIINKVVVEK
jgi:peptidyl-prolyl cis-trans isomerase B (cyclophilin B)